MCVLSLLKIGVRCDSAFISVYDASGTEVENAELLFCEEGAHTYVPSQHCSMACELKLLSLHIYVCYSFSCLVKGAYLFKSYSSGHPYDTAKVGSYYSVVTCSNPQHCMLLCTVYHMT